MSPSASARVRLVPLCAAVFARSAGQGAVRAYVFILLLTGLFHDNVLGLVFGWLCLAALPAFALAPLAGALAGSPARRVTMIGATLLGLAAVGLCAAQGERGPWLGCLGVLTVEGAFFAAGRQTLAPIAARRADLWFPRVQALLLVAVAAGELTGLAIGLV